MKVLTTALIRSSEENAVKSGAFSFEKLMEIAGNEAAKIICEKFEICGRSVAVLCGNGNNGGDGFVIARYLYEHGADVTVICPLGKPKTPDAEHYYNKLPAVNVTDTFSDDYEIIIDAVFGIGFNREPTPEITQLFEKVNKSSGVKISIDMPSGAAADTGKVFTTAIKADLTVTFIALKPGLLLPHCSDFAGEICVADIGVPVKAYSYSVTEKPVFGKRPHNSHKGTFGTALLICGSYGMAGAAILSAKAALRSGVGIAKAVLCDGIYSAFTAAVPEAVCLPKKQSVSGTLSAETIDIPSLTENCNAVLFGCGIGQSDDTFKILEMLMSQNEKTLIIDADGINLLCKNIELLRKRKAPVILTPHPGEMARLCNVTVSEVEADRISFARDFAVKYGCVLVLKGANTIIAESDGEISFNLTGNPGMATGGSGDVLAGIIVALLAQGMKPEIAAKAAVYLHGEAGDKAAERKGHRAMLPSDIIEEL